MPRRDGNGKEAMKTLTRMAAADVQKWRRKI